MSRLREFLTELRDNWDDHYWWARHPILQALLLGLLGLALGVAGAWLEEHARQRVRTAAQGAL